MDTKICKRCGKEKDSYKFKRPWRDAPFTRNVCGACCMRRQRENLERDFLDAFDRKCECCGETDSEALLLGRRGSESGQIVIGRQTMELYRTARREGWAKDKYVCLCKSCKYSDRSVKQARTRVKTMLSAEYLAGFFDGEGSIYTGTSGRTTYENLIVSIGNCNQLIIDMIQVQFSECRRYTKKSEGNARACYMVHWHGRKAIPILTFMKDYLVIKKQAALFALELAELQFAPGRTIAPEIREKRAELGTKIHLLAKRGT